MYLHVVSQQEYHSLCVFSPTDKRERMVEKESEIERKRKTEIVWHFPVRTLSSLLKPLKVSYLREEIHDFSFFFFFFSLVLHLEWSQIKFISPFQKPERNKEQSFHWSFLFFDIGYRHHSIIDLVLVRPIDEIRVDRIGLYLSDRNLISIDLVFIGTSAKI